MTGPRRPLLTRVRARLAAAWHADPSGLDRLTWARGDLAAVDAVIARDTLRAATDPAAPVDPDACTHCALMLCEAFPDCPPEAPHMAPEYDPAGGPR